MSNLNLLTTINLIEAQYGQRYLLDRTTILTYINVIQQMAFNKDLNCFLVWDSYITINQKLTFASAGYTSAINGDIGKTVVDGTSGATATLVSFNNTTKIWIVTPISGTILGTEHLTITTGTGAGTLSTAEGYIGPYTVTSATSPIRKILGVTSLTEQQILYPKDLFPWVISSLPGQGIDDYGFFANYVTSFDNDRYQWITGRIDNFNNTFTFLSAPNLTSSLYRMVYYRNPVDIVDEDDTAGNYIIPDRFRYSVVLKCVEALAENAEYGTDPYQVIMPILKQFWSTFMINNGKTPGDNYRSIGFI